MDRHQGPPWTTSMQGTTGFSVSVSSSSGFERAGFEWAGFERASFE
ncbi:MAG: hypothetical protein JSU95_01185 [Betaproteobacteria bacterium]|nr:MAG: hypothetical protein JSU95_01185 [Betaproteobacteria bacterium]